jgi:hypothetical protein
MKGVSEEECYEAVCPGIRAKHVEDPQLGTAEPDPGQELELEVGLTVQLALDVVLQDQLREFLVLQSLK